MFIDDSVTLLSKYESQGHVPPTVSSEVMSRLLLFASYPDNVIMPGGTDMALLQQRYGNLVFCNLMKHLCESLAGRAAIMDYAYNNILTQAVQQDPNISNLLYTMYFQMWTELRRNGIEHFPYVFAKLGTTNALFYQLRGKQLLEYAGL